MAERKEPVLHAFTQMRRTTRILVVMACIALVAVITAGIVWQLRGPYLYAPLKLPDRPALVGGEGDPPTIAPTTLLDFGTTSVCNNSGEDLLGHVSVTLISTEAPPKASVAIYAGIPAPVPKGCTSGYALKFVLTSPLAPGLWELALTVSVQQNGRVQTLSVVSYPFRVQEQTP